MTICRSAGLGAGVVSLALLAGLVAIPQIAAAKYSIHSPHVERGETAAAIEVKSWYNVPHHGKINGTREYKVSVEHAFTSFWKSELEGKFERKSDDGAGYGKVEWSNTFQLTPQGQYWADFGLRAKAEFSTKSGSPYELEFGPLIQKTFGRTVATVNLFAERELGSNASDDTECSYAAQVRYRLSPFFEPAVDAFGSPGNFEGFAPSREQSHQIGPGFYGETRLGDGKFKYSALVLRGITAPGSPEWTFVAQLEYEL
jgi:hypothetical protein